MPRYSSLGGVGWVAALHQGFETSTGTSATAQPRRRLQQANTRPARRFQLHPEHNCLEKQLLSCV